MLLISLSLTDTVLKDPSKLLNDLSEEYDYPLEELDFRVETEQQDRLNPLYDAIKSKMSLRKSPLKVIKLRMTVKNQQQVMSLLPYLQPGILQIIEIFGAKNPGKSLEIDEIKKTEQWKKAKEIRIENFEIRFSIPDFLHFDVGDIIVGTISLADLKEIKNAFQTSPSFKSFTLHYQKYDDQVKPVEGIPEPQFYQHCTRIDWYFKRDDPKKENLKIKKVSPDVQNAPKAPPKPKDPVVEMLEMVDEEAAEVYSKIDDEIKFLTESEAAVKHLISIGKGTPEKLSEFKTLALALVPVISEAKEVRDSIREGVKDLMKSDVRNLDPTGVLTDIKRIKLMKWVFQQLRLMLSGKDPLPQPVSDELLLSKAPPEAIQDLRTCLDFVDLWRNKSLAIRCLVAHAKINPKSSIPQDTVERSLKSAAQIVQKFDSNEIHELLDLTKSSDDSRIAAQLSQIAEKYGNAYRTTCQSLIIYQRSIQKMKKLLANALKSPDLQKDPLIPEILDLLPQVLGIPEALKGILAPIRAAFDDIGAREIVKRNAFYRIMISNEQFPQETRDRCEKIGDLVDKMKLEELEFPDDQTIRNVFPQWKGQKKPMYVNPKLSEYKQDVRDALLVENLSKIRPEAVEKLRILCASTSILRDFIRKAKGWIAHSSEPSSDEDYLRFMHLVLYHLPKSERNCGIFEESLEKIRNESSPLKHAQLITTFHDLILKDQEDKYVGLQPTVAILNWMCESRGVNLDVPLEIPNEKTLETRFPGFLEYKRKCLEEDGGDAEKKLPEPPKFEMSPEDKVIVGKLSKLDEKAAKNYGLAVEYLPISRRFLQKAKGLISMALKEPELRDLPGDMIKFCVDGLPTISESVSSFQFLVDAVRMTVDFPQKVRELFPALEQMINISDPSGGFSAYSHASNRIDSFYRQKRIQPPSSEEEEDLEFPEDEEIRMVFPNWEGIEKKLRKSRGNSPMVVTYRGYSQSLMGHSGDASPVSWQILMCYCIMCYFAHMLPWLMCYYVSFTTKAHVLLLAHVLLCLMCYHFSCATKN
uniref:FTH domain-containing protein n=1 Tax=Caenorhabditis tropicalis TaxID=1561998 RepID=A0A1I7UIC8_9PELO